MKRVFFTLILISLCNISCKFMTSKTSAVTIKFPANIPADVEGYSLCVERQDHKDTNCSASFLTQNKIAATGVNNKLNNNCASGYKLKMWLWKGNNVPTYRMDDKFGTDFSYENGYLKIPKEKLTGGSLPVKLHFLSMNSNQGSSSSSDTVDVEIEVEIMSSGSSVDDKTSKETGAVTLDTTCNLGDVKENSGSSGSSGSSTGTGSSTNPGGSGSSANPGGSSSSGSDAPTGQIITVTKTPAIPKGYPTMIVYSNLASCQPCRDLIAELRTPSNSAKFKGNMHIYDVDGPGITSPNGSITGVPTIEFYDKEAKYQGRIVGGYWNQINSYFDKLTK